MNKRYNWTRFWVPREGQIALDDGYLSDPESEYTPYYSSDATTLASIQDVGVLILLGEPGIGKTDALEQEKERILAQIKLESGQLLYLNLADYSSDALLVRDLFEGEAFNSLKAGQHRLYLFLDSLDECRLTIPKISTLLFDRLKSAPVDRLFLRITCRGAVWPSSFEQGIKGLWGEKSVGIYSLAPLRRNDVLTACVAEGLDGHTFLQEVNSKNAIPFANRPISLQFLLNIFRRDKILPQTSAELYWK